MYYTKDQAARYESIALEGSTFAISLLPAISSLGDLTKSTVLDFGAGTGRSARALRNSGAQHIVAVDKNEAMLNAAQRYSGVAYVQMGRSLPIKEGSMDTAFCANVLSEFDQLDGIVATCRQVWKTLGAGKPFVVVVPNPTSVYCDYVSYRYIDVDTPMSGSPITCLLKGAAPTLIQDYYWTTDDYVGALEAAGFEVEDISFPTAEKTSNWLDETSVAPDLVIRSKRGSV